MSLSQLSQEWQNVPQLQLPYFYGLNGLPDYSHILEHQLRLLVQNELRKQELAEAQRRQSIQQPIKIEASTPSKYPSVEIKQVKPPQKSQLSVMQNAVKLRNMIDTIIRNIGIDDGAIEKKRQELTSIGDSFVMQVFEALLRKFERLKKTKEEMVKYCMRKSFKCVMEKLKKKEGGSTKQFITQYFNSQKVDQNFVVPFKKNSTQKTMNSAFLIQVFNSEQFVEDYKKFLDEFKITTWKDNNKKIAAYVPIVEQCIQTKNLKILDGYKRLPWTTVIINKCQELARTLLQYTFYESSSTKHDKKGLKGQGIDSSKQELQRPKRQQNDCIRKERMNLRRRPERFYQELD